MAYHIRQDSVDYEFDGNAKDADGKLYFVQVYTDAWFAERTWLTDELMHTTVADTLDSVTSLLDIETGEAFSPYIHDASSDEDEEADATEESDAVEGKTE